MTSKYNPIKIGLIGYGRAAVRMHAVELEAHADKFTLAAICDPRPERLDPAKEKHGCATYLDYRDLIADPSVELVDVVTGTVDHARIAVAALDAGKHVFLEKPIAVSYAEAKTVADAAARSSGKLFVRHNRRFAPDFVHVREIIDSGLLGEVFTIHIRCLTYDLRDDWQTLRECGGGLLLNMGPHFVDQSLEFLGREYESIWADLKLVAAAGDAEDHVKVIFKGKNGLVVDMEISGGVAFDKLTYYDVYGKHGALICDGKQILLKYYDPDKVAILKASAEVPGQEAAFGSGREIPWVEETIPVKPAARDLWIEVYKAIREGGQYPITVEQSLQVMKVISEVKSMTQFQDMERS